MPAVHPALAEIEDRLEELRYRLNRRTLVGALCPLVAALLGIAALVSWSALRAPPESFAVAVIAASLGVAILCIWTALSLWGRWLSLEAVARWADQRAAMQERLSTLLWLSRSGASAPLTPVLVADTLDHGRAWQPAVLVPPRFPYEVAYPLLALLALLAVPFFGKPNISLADQLAMANKVKNQMEMVVPFPPRPPTPPPAERAGGDGGESLLEAQDEGGGESSGAKGEGERGDGRRAVLTDQLRDAIRNAVERLEKTDAPKDLSKSDSTRSDSDLPETDAGPKPGLFPIAKSRQGGALEQSNDKSRLDTQGHRGEGGGSEAASESRGKQGDAERSLDPVTGLPRGRNDNPKDDRAAVEAPDAKPRDQQGEPRSMPGSDRSSETYDGKASNGREHDQAADEAREQGKQDKNAKPHEGDTRALAGNQTGDGKIKGGSRASAGSGTDPEGLFAGEGSGGTGKPIPTGPAGTFKLTLGSFLNGAGGGKTDKKPKASERVSASAQRAAVSEPPALNPNQTADDALRRADIPPEYEDIVRRIYSARPTR